MVHTSWRRRELVFLILYAVAFYAFIIHRSLKLSSDHYRNLRGLGTGWIGGRLNDVSDAQWRNTRGNLSILTIVFGIFSLVANVLRASYHLQARGMSIVWLLISLAYVYYLHGAWYVFRLNFGYIIVFMVMTSQFPLSRSIIFIVLIASTNFLLVKTFGRTKYFLVLVWIFNLFFLIYNRLSEGYRFSSFGDNWAYLDNYRGAFRWHICFNFVTLRMISYAHDYHWAHDSRFDQKKHLQTCAICSSGKTCYLLLQERSVQNDKFSFGIYLCYLLFAPLYIAGPIISFNAFVSQLDSNKRNCSLREVAWYGVRWFFCLFLMELMTHFFYYNAFVISGSWKQLSPTDIFIIGYGVLNFMWLKFLLIWRFFRFWGLINGIDAPENMPRCINNCHNLESFWKSWHASFNKWLVRYMYIPLGGSGRKLLNVWVIFTFVAIWHDLEWKLLSWAWLTCVFFVPEMIIKSAANTFQARNAFWAFVSRELSAISGAITITCLMVANLVGYVIGPSGINWLVSRFLQREGIPTLAGMFATFYVGTKLMFHIRDAKQRK